MQFFEKPIKTRTRNPQLPMITVGADYIAINEAAVQLMAPEESIVVSFGSGNGELGLNLAPESWEYTRTIRTPNPEAKNRAVNLNKVGELAGFLREGKAAPVKYLYDRTEENIHIFKVVE